MSGDEHTKLVLQRRARILAKPLQGTTRAADEFEVAVCTVGSEAFAFPVHLLREIVPLPKVTTLPFAPDWLVGIAQVRGSLLAVFDLARLCHVRGKSAPGHLVVVDAREGPVGFSVDQVLSCRHVSPSALSRQSADATGRDASLGVTTDLVVVLDVPRLLTLPELVIG